MIRRFKILPHERGFLFREGALIDMLRPGSYWHFDPAMKLRLDRVSTRQPWLTHADLDLIVRSGLLGNDAVVLDLADSERALVWIDGRFDRIVKPGRHVIWKVDHEVRVEIASIRDAQFVHPDATTIAKAAGTSTFLEWLVVDPGFVAVVFRDGALHGVMQPGTYAFWRDAGVLRVEKLDLREQVLDISGQEIMTADKVTLRLNALVAYRITDPLRAVTEAGDASLALYRSAQLALREVIGTKDLDTLLASRDQLARELEELTRARATALGIAVITVGIRDVILPGEMKELMNKVTEARKAAEAALITRREETAAMRMQANTAKILESSPTLMRLRELEVLEKVSHKANLTVLVGDGGGLSEKVVKML